MTTLKLLTVDNSSTGNGNSLDGTVGSFVDQGNLTPPMIGFDTLLDGEAGGATGSSGLMVNGDFSPPPGIPLPIGTIGFLGGPPNSLSPGINGQFGPGPVVAPGGNGGAVISPGPAIMDMPASVGGSTTAPVDPGPLSNATPTQGGGSSQTVTYQGSGLVFVNTYSANVSASYQSAIIAAENFFQSHITTSETLYFNFDTASGGFVGENTFYWITNVPYTTLKNALASHATSADDQAAVASLPANDPSGGQGFNITVDLAEALGLTSVNLQQYAGTVDLNSSLAYFYNPEPCRRRVRCR